MVVAEFPEIPDKLFFRIGEVSEIVGVEPYVLRYWESEFPALAPRKSSSGQRMFRRKDVELLLRIKHLLYDQKFTIEGARKALTSEAKTPKRQPAQPVVQEALFAAPSGAIPEIRREVEAILKLLS
ncbi:MAG TPA: MerR family transcriptional regulator [Bryobacteraceae bacterium]|nr:MerR family transcriptional regulator [Bryobacteraceae bacterium]